MARYNLRDIIQAISIENVALGTYLTTSGTKYKLFPGEPQPMVLPQRTPVQDNAVGDGRAYPKQSKPYYFNSIAYPYAHALNSTMAVRLIRMFLGGTISSTVNSSPGTTDWLIQQLHPGSAPMVCNLLRKLGGEGFIFGDSYVNTLGISQSGAGEPRITSQFGNGGHFAQLSALGLLTSDIAAMPSYLKMHGRSTSLTFTDGFTSYDFASSHTLIDVGFTGNQNVIVDQLPGDNFLDVSNPCQGAYSQTCYIDVQSGQITCKVFMDASFAAFASWLPNRKLTSVFLKFASCEFVGTGTQNFEIEIQIPVAEFNLAPDQQANFSSYSFTINAIEGDPSTGSLIKARIRRATSAGTLDEVAP